MGSSVVNQRYEEDSYYHPSYYQEPKSSYGPSQYAASSGYGDDLGYGGGGYKTKCCPLTVDIIQVIAILAAIAAATAFLMPLISMNIMGRKKRSTLGNDLQQIVFAGKPKGIPQIFVTMPKGTHQFEMAQLHLISFGPRLIERC